MVLVFIPILTFCMLALMVPYNGRYSTKQVKWILMVLIIALAGIGSCIEPKATYDLFRHYEIIERVRHSSYSLPSFLAEGYRITDYNYKYTYVYNILIYVVAKVLPNQALPFITIITTYGIFLYIIFREFDEDNMTNRNIVLSSAIFSVLMPYLYIYSNIRTALAGAVVAYGIYRLYKDKKTLVFAICTGVAVLIHPIAVAIVPFIILSRIKPGVKGVVVTLVLPSLLFPIMEYFRLQSGNEFLFKISAKYYNYTLVREDNQGRVFLYSTVSILLILAVLALWAKKDEKTEWKEKEYSLLNLIIWYAMFSLGYLRNYEMMTRLPYSMALLSPVIVNTLFNKKEMSTLIAQFAYTGSTVMVFVLAVLGLYENIAWLM